MDTQEKVAGRVAGGWRILNRRRRLRVAFALFEGHPKAFFGIKARPPANSQKGERPAGDFLRWLYREGRLTAAEMAGRLRALEDLAAEKLRPSPPD
jgi:hypothetical protein